VTIEKALITALFDGASESPLWTTFLDRLRRVTRADYAVLIFNPPGRRLDDALHLISGDAPASRIAQSFRKHPAAVDPSPRRTLKEGRPYSQQELFGSSDTPNAMFYRELVASVGITAIRQMRVREVSGVDAWLTIARRGSEFRSHDAVLLTAIAPVLRGVLQLYVNMERERFAASLTRNAVRRLQFGWLTLDTVGKVLDCDEQAALVLSNSGVIRRRANGRLAVRPLKLERKVFLALNRVAESPESRSHAITLSREPWLDMLIVPARTKSIISKATPAAIVYVHGDSWRSSECREQLAELFALSPREARLALALSRGMTLAEAASTFGLTIETARTYSKSIFAKTGARGQPDLVRIVMRSVLAMAASN
jgi:DNA-binding CsgD family transcriptional regulator